MNRRLEATVDGAVQGVGYRWFVRREAARLLLSGWVANQSDGSVRVVAEGPPSSLGQLLERLRSGPPGASVESVSEEWLPATGSFGTFEIRVGGHRGD